MLYDIRTSGKAAVTLENLTGVNSVCLGQNKIALKH